MDLSDILLSSDRSSQKVYLSDSDTLIMPTLSGAGDSAGVGIVPHGYGSDELIFQVWGYGDSSGATVPNVVLPWQSSDGRLTLFAYVDSINLYIVGIHSDASGFGDPERNFHYSYRILIP